MEGRKGSENTPDRRIELKSGRIAAYVAGQKSVQRKKQISLCELLTVLALEEIGKRVTSAKENKGSCCASSM